MPRSLAPLAVGAVLALSGCTGVAASATTRTVPVAAAVTMEPQPLPPPAADRLPGQVPAGTVQHGAGPHDDRFALSGTRLSSGTVDAALRVTSDASEVVVLAVVADFYDADGALLGSTRRTHAHDRDGAGSRAAAEQVPLELRAEPEYRAEVASAVLSVPVLVDEQAPPPH